MLKDGHTGPGAAGQLLRHLEILLYPEITPLVFFVFSILVINLVVTQKVLVEYLKHCAFHVGCITWETNGDRCNLNAGILTPDEAKARREAVTKEADFYGSMDGIEIC